MLRILIASDRNMWINFSKTVQFISFLWVGIWRHRVNLVLCKTATRDPCVFFTDNVFYIFRKCFQCSWKIHVQKCTFRNYIYIYIHTWVSLVAQMVKNPPAVLETWVQSLGWQDPLEEGMTIHSNIFAMNRGAWWAAVHRVAKSRTRLGN